MKKTLIAGAASIVVASCVGLAVALPAQAESLTTSPSSTSASETGDSTTGDRAGRGHGGRGLDAAALATKLGLTEASITDALSAVRDATEPAEHQSADATDEEKEAARDARKAAFVGALAAELNIDEDTVTEALADIRTEKAAERTAAMVATLEEAVADGTLTQVEADAVQKAIDAKVLGDRGGRTGGDGGDRGHAER